MNSIYIIAYTPGKFKGKSAQEQESGRARAQYAVPLKAAGVFFVFSVVGREKKVYNKIKRISKIFKFRFPLNNKERFSYG